MKYVLLICSVACLFFTAAEIIHAAQTTADTSGGSDHART
jgi:hypothetical protein